MHANTSIYNAQMYAHVITLFASIPFTCMYSGVRATGVFFDDVLALDYNYPSHILTEPDKCTVFNMVFELFKISGVSNFILFL